MELKVKPEGGVMRLCDLPERSGVKIYVDADEGEAVLIFDHLDGMYSYCWVKGDESQVVHLSAVTPLVQYEDGYKIREVKDD